MIDYANMRYDGDGISMDRYEAAQYFKMAADEGNINAMFKYALISDTGDEIPVDKVEAAKYFKGNINALYKYARML